MNDTIFYYLSWYVPGGVLIIIPAFALLKSYQKKQQLHSFWKRTSLVSLFWVLLGLGVYALNINIWFHYVYTSGHAGTLGRGVPASTVGIELFVLLSLVVAGIFAFKWAIRIKESSA